MVTTRLIAVTRTADSVVVQVAVSNIVSVTPKGTGSLIRLHMADPPNGQYLTVNETPAAITTAANLNP